MPRRARVPPVPAAHWPHPCPRAWALSAEWRWHRNQDEGPESADSISVVRDPDCKSARAVRLAAWRANLAAAGGATQQQQGQSPAALEEEAEEQALLLEREAERRAATAVLREHLHEEEAEQQQAGLWGAISRWAQRAARALGWLP